MKSYRKPTEYQPVITVHEATIRYNLLKKLAIYGRQSTKNQVHKRVFSREMQTEILIAKGISLGWPEESIILYIENLRADGTVRAASGRLRIDQREGLSALVERIINGEISAVMVSRVDRLFRDETEIEPNKFIIYCKAHNVLVITLERTYNFSNSDDADLFRDECRQAAAELRTQRERMGGPKDLAAQAGYYDGRSLCPGFFIDHRRVVIVDREERDNPQWKRLNAYLPHQAVIEEIYDLLVSFAWNIPGTYRELRKRPVLFPDFEEWVGTTTPRKMFLKKVAGGYHMSYKAFLRLLCNVTLIGQWPYRGKIRLNNHPAIIDEDRFWIGFYLVSDVTPDGEPLERETCKRYQKTTTQETNPRPLALLEGVIEATDPKKAVYVHPQYRNWYYTIVWRGTLEGPYPEKFSMLVSQVDTLFMEKVRERLSTPTDLEELRQLLATIIEDYRTARQDAVKRLEKVNEHMTAALEQLLDKDTLPPTRKALNQVYAQLDAERDALEKSLTPSDKSEEAQIIDYHEKLQRFSSIDEMNLADVQVLIKAMVKMVTFEGLSCHFMRLCVTWRSPQWKDEEAIIWRVNGRAPQWTEEEAIILLEGYPTLGQIDLMKKLPRRTWYSMKQKASKEGISRKVRTASEIPDLNLSLEDIGIIDQYSLDVSSLASSDISVHWCK